MKSNACGALNRTTIVTPTDRGVLSDQVVSLSDQVVSLSGVWSSDCDADCGSHEEDEQNSVDDGGDELPLGSHARLPVSLGRADVVGAHHPLHAQQSPVELLLQRIRSAADHLVHRRLADQPLSRGRLPLETRFAGCRGRVDEERADRPRKERRRRNAVLPPTCRILVGRLLLMMTTMLMT